MSADSWRLSGAWLSTLLHGERFELRALFRRRGVRGGSRPAGPPQVQLAEATRSAAGFARVMYAGRVQHHHRIHRAFERGREFPLLAHARARSPAEPHAAPRPRAPQMSRTRRSNAGYPSAGAFGLEQTDKCPISFCRPGRAAPGARGRPDPRPSGYQALGRRIQLHQPSWERRPASWTRPLRPQARPGNVILELFHELPVEPEERPRAGALCPGESLRDQRCMPRRRGQVTSPGAPKELCSRFRRGAPSTTSRKAAALRDCPL